MSCATPITSSQDISSDCCCQVETAGQMAYLHHRLSQCPHENDLLAAARQLGRQAGRPAAFTAPHKVMPLQVCLSLCTPSLMPLHCYLNPSSTAPIAPPLPPPSPAEAPSQFSAPKCTWPATAGVFSILWQLVCTKHGISRSNWGME